MIVGSLGLASNIVGLFLFHGMLFIHTPIFSLHIDFFLEHGHSHGHSHKRSTPSSSASSVVHIPTDGRVASGSITPTQKQFIPTSPRSHHSPSESFSSLYGHPAATRASLVQTANEMASAQSPRRGSLHLSDPASQVPVSESHQPNDVLSENTPLLHDEEGHSHKHGNNAQGSMNMRALVLHVVGDALGNVGVIMTGLIIWLSTWQFKYYCDPVISLIITVIIFSNSLPLGMVIFISIFKKSFHLNLLLIVRSASFILLQGVPPTVSLEEVKNSILSVEGVLSLHELHVWQLSESKLVASVHVLASRNHDFMPVAVKIRKALHHLGIHSCTIQPEYYQPTTRAPDEHLKVSYCHRGIFKKSSY